ncbi:helix-turn-helix domain-containing protein [Treponema denticola]|nr:helix-turn-helix transcriptional regulator [Treponema denticola]
MIFSEFVIFVRKKLNLSQKQLADAIDVSHSTI